MVDSFVITVSPYLQHDPVNACVADPQLGGNRPGGHAARRHRTNFIPVQDKPFPPKVIGAASEKPWLSYTYAATVLRLRLPLESSVPAETVSVHGAVFR